MQFNIYPSIHLLTHIQFRVMSGGFVYPSCHKTVYILHRSKQSFAKLALHFKWIWFIVDRFSLYSTSICITFKSDGSVWLKKIRQANLCFSLYIIFLNNGRLADWQNRYVCKSNRFLWVAVWGSYIMCPTWVSSFICGFTAWMIVLSSIGGPEKNVRQCDDTKQKESSGRNCEVSV